MLEKLNGIEERYEQLGKEFMEVGSDYQRAAEINKERVELEPIVEKAREYRRAMKSIQEAKAMLESEKDPEMLALAEVDIAELGPKIELLKERSRACSFPKTRVMKGTSLLRYALAQAATRLQSSPRTCSACTCVMPKISAGRWRYFQRTRSVSAAIRK